MIDWIGSLKIVEKSQVRLVASLSPMSGPLGWGLSAVSSIVALLLWKNSPWLGFLAGVVAMVGIFVATLKREITVDRGAGIVRVKQGLLGLSSSVEIPLFHLRAVVIFAKPKNLRAGLDFTFGPRYVAYLDKRVGDAIYLDESNRSAGILKLGEAIAEAADIRLEYDAT